MKYTFFEDPGHGWLKVPLKKLEKLGIVNQISIYSYMQGDYAYLEEDCDAPLFIKTAKRRGQTVELDVRVSDKPSIIRGYPPFRLTEE